VSVVQSERLTSPRLDASLHPNAEAKGLARRLATRESLDMSTVGEGFALFDEAQAGSRVYARNR